MTLKTMLQYIYPSLCFDDFKKRDTNDIMVLFKSYKNDTELVYIDDYKRYQYPVFAGLMLDYKQQDLITNIKTNM